MYYCYVMGTTPLNVGVDPPTQNGRMATVSDFFCNVLHANHTQYGNATYAAVDENKR